jgi:hypothetical protein
MMHDFILLDRSGSMAQRWDETLVSVNAYVKELAAKPESESTEITLAVFDYQSTMHFDILRTAVAVKDFIPLTPTEVSPRGWTPLYDAIARIVSLAEEANPSNSCIIIMTDGAENMSRSTNRATAKAALDRVRGRNWQVMFLGVDFDNSTQATDLGNATSQTIQARAYNLAETMSSTASLRARYGTTGQTMEWSDEDKKKANS